MFKLKYFLSTPNIVCLWLIGILFAFNIYPANPQLSQAVALLWIIAFLKPLSIQKFIFSSSFSETPLVLYAFTTFILFASGVGYFSVSPIQSLSFSGLTLIGTLICAKVWDIIKKQEIKAIQYYAIVGTVSLALASLPSYTGSGRLDTVRNANGMGLMAFSLIVCAFAIRRKLLQLPLVFTGGFIIYLTNSRSATIGCILGLITLVLFTSSKSTDRSKLLTLYCLVWVGVLALFWDGNLLNNFLDSANTYFELGNSHRGVDSGFSGRTDAWAKAIELWHQEPLFGVGYRVHEIYYEGFEHSSSHNGYLALLAETGLIGVGSWAVIILVGWTKLIYFSLKGNMLSIIGLSLVSGYLFIAFFERFMINFGNPTSVLFLMFLLMPTSSHKTSYKSKPS